MDAKSFTTGYDIVAIAEDDAMRWIFRKQRRKGAMLALALLATQLEEEARAAMGKRALGTANRLRGAAELIRGRMGWVTERV
jgi:hypothetical protein